MPSTTAPPASTWTVGAEGLSGVLEGLDPAQRAAVLADAPVVAVLAGAGSGKTRVLTRRIARRIADGSVEARHVLALTFTRKAAGELRSRIGALTGHLPAAASSPSVHTFHALGGALLQRWWLDRGERPWDVTRDRQALLREALRAAGAEHLRPGELGAEIEWAKATLLDPDAYEGLADQAALWRDVDVPAVAAAWRRYEEAKQGRRVLDVDDLVQLPASLLAEDQAFAEARRWWHRHLFVDEAQDLNPAQLRLVTLLLGDEPDLCLVGDPDQAVYGWNGADPGLLVDLAAGLPAGSVHRLGTNHRSTAPIVAAASSILRSPTAPVSGSTDDTRWPLPEVTGHPDEVAESHAIAHRLLEARWRGARAWSAMAVLARTRAQLDVIAAALAARDIPHRLPGSLLDRPEVLEVLRGLRAIDAGRRLPLRRLAGDLPELVEQVLATAAPPAPPGEVPVEGEEAPDPVAELRRAHLDALVELVDECRQAVPDADLDVFRSWSRGVLGARGGEQGYDRRGVTLTTFHRAKGLEWPVVVVAGCETGLVPHRRATSPEARAEERRLAYVAATRAVEELHLTWAHERSTPWGVGRAARSPFLEGLEASVARPVDDSKARAARLAGLRRARAALRQPALAASPSSRSPA